MSKPDQTGTNGLSAPGDDFRTTRRSLLGAAAGALAAGATLGLTNQQSTAKASQQTAEPGQGDRQVLVYPSHNTRTASPFTEISFRGITEDELGPVDVAGSESGGHTGIMRPHADGNGVSYLPDVNLQPGERVTIRAGMPLANSPDGSLSFTVARPGETSATDANPTVDNPKIPPWEFKSRPDLKPPVVEVTTPASKGVAPGMIFVSPRVTGGQSGALILDNDGEVVWWSTSSVQGVTYFDFRVQTYHNQPVLTWYEGPTPTGYGTGHYVIADTSHERIAEFQVGNGYAGGGDLHEFRLTPRGSALIAVYHVIDWDLSEAGGSPYGRVIDGIVQEVEIESGRVLFEWHSLDHVAMAESHSLASPVGEQVFDYFHLNSIAETPDGDLIISARHTSAIYKIDRQSSEVIWRLNGKQSDFAMGPATVFDGQHDAQMQANGELTLFDNHAVNGEAHSRGLMLALDEERMTATFMRQYVHPEKLLSRAMANMQVLPNGNVLIGWGTAPVFSEFAHDGELVFNGRLPEGAQSYRAYRHEWSGAPSDPPDIAVEITGQNHANVYASWNGATEVASWRVTAGPSKDALTVAGTAKKDGFETTIPVEIVANFYAVEALDADGKVIGTSTKVQPVRSSTDDAATRATSWIAPRLTRPAPIRNEFRGTRTFDPGRSG